MKYSKLILSTYNNLLDDLESDNSIPRGIATELELSETYDVSRSTIRKVISIMFEKEIALKDGTNKILLRLPKKKDYFSIKEVKNTKSDKVERTILKKLYNYKLNPGNRFSELELAKQLKTSTITVREALMNISQTGLIKKRHGQKWEVIALTQSKIIELMEFRLLLENYAINFYESSPQQDKNVKELQLLLQKHKALKKEETINVNDFTALEKHFHYTLINMCNNQFIEKAYHSLFILISYHIGQIKYEKVKILLVLDQHIHIIEALLNKDYIESKIALGQHLDHAKKSMTDTNVV